MKRLWQSLILFFKLLLQWRRILKLSRKHQHGHASALYIILNDSSSDNFIASLLKDSSHQETLCLSNDLPKARYSLLKNRIYFYFESPESTLKEQMLGLLQKIWSFHLGRVQKHVIVLLSSTDPEKSPPLLVRKILSHYAWTLLVYDIENYPGLLSLLQSRFEHSNKTVIWRVSSAYPPTLAIAWLFDTIRQLSKEACPQTRLLWLEACLNYETFLKKLSKQIILLNPICHCYLTSQEFPFKTIAVLEEIEMDYSPLRSPWRARFFWIMSAGLSIALCLKAYSYFQNSTLLEASTQPFHTQQDAFHLSATLQSVFSGTQLPHAFQKALIQWLLSSSVKPVIDNKVSQLNQLLSHPQHQKEMLQLAEELQHFDSGSVCNQKCLATWKKTLPALNAVQFEWLMRSLPQPLPWNHASLLTSISKHFQSASLLLRVEASLLEKISTRWPNELENNNPVPGLYQTKGKEHFFTVIETEWLSLLQENGAKYHPEINTEALKKSVIDRYWQGYRREWQSWLSHFNFPNFHSLEEADRQLVKFGRKPTPFDQFLQTASEPMHSGHFSQLEELGKVQTLLPEYSQCLFDLHRDISKLLLETDSNAAALNYASEHYHHANTHSALYRCVLSSMEMPLSIHNKQLHALITRLLNAPLANTWNLILQRAAVALEGELHELLDYHKKYLTNCFPLAKSAENCDPAALTHFYQPDVGLLDQALTKTLRPFLQIVHDDAWRPRVWLGKAFPFSKNVLTILHQQKDRQKALFATDSPHPSHRYRIKAVDAAGCAVMTLTNNDERFIYRNGKAEWQSGIWMSQGQEELAEIRLQDAELHTLAQLQFRGPWSWLRLLASAHRTAEHGQTVRLSWVLKGVGRDYKVIYETEPRA